MRPVTSSQAIPAIPYSSTGPHLPVVGKRSFGSSEASGHARDIIAQLSFAGCLSPSRSSLVSRFPTVPRIAERVTRQELGEATEAGKSFYYPGIGTYV